jgi:hypothetical protein
MRMGWTRPGRAGRGVGGFLVGGDAPEFHADGPVAAVTALTRP